MYHIRESIRPSADLRNHYNEISKQCREENEAVIITVNGRGDTVSLSYDEYKSMKSRIELLELLAEENKIYYCTYRYCRYWYSKKSNEYRKKFR